MYPVSFDYVIPNTLDEAVQKLQQNKQAMVIAGGVGLTPAMSMHRVTPALVVDLSKVADLSGISSLPTGGIRVGALTTYAALAEDSSLKKNYPALAEAILGLSDPAVRNRATLGGALAEAHPASDAAAAALVLNATLQTRGADGERAIPAAEFFTCANQTALKATEIIYAVDFPDGGQFSAYEKFKHPASGYAICGVAVCVEKSNGKVVNTRAALVGATDYPQSLAAVESALAGKELSAKNLTAAIAQISAEKLNFVADMAASAAYRAHLTEVLLKRALARVA